MDQSFKRFIQDLPLFRKLPLVVLDELVDLFEYQKLLRGETLFQQGDTADSFYILLSGRLQVIRKKPVAELTPGDSFGELALIGDQARSATIIGQRDSELGKLHRHDFDAILKAYPEISVELLKVVGSWLTTEEKFNSNKVSGIVTMVLLDRDAKAKSLPGLVAQSLKALGATHHLTLENLAQYFNWDSHSTSQHQQFREEEVARWLSEHEQAGDFILLETTDEPSRWRDFCLRQADRIMFITNQQSAPGAQSFERLPDSNVETLRQLVLVHSDAQSGPTATAQWLSHHNVNSHFHIRIDQQKDIQRLAREIAKKSVAVVLGGGGARSFAQIGMLKAMEELGIPVDKVSGVSMGAIIAAQYADGYSSDEILKLNIEAWLKGKPHKGFTLPISSLLSASRASELAKVVFGHRHIEDLWLPFFCVSTDLTTLAARYHYSGEIWTALLASGAIPGICSSIISENNTLLVDGGLLDNLPVERMKQQHEGKVIAVDVATDKGLLPNVKGPIPPNGFKALWQQITANKNRRPFPHIFKLMMHTVTLASKVNSEKSRQVADLCLNLKCNDYGLMEMRNLEALAETGYSESYPVLEAWLKGQNSGPSALS